MSAAGVAVAVAVASSSDGHVPLMGREIRRLSDVTFRPLPVCARTLGGPQ